MRTSYSTEKISVLTRQPKYRPNRKRKALLHNFPSIYFPFQRCQTKRILPVFMVWCLLSKYHTYTYTVHLCIKSLLCFQANVKHTAFTSMMLTSLIYSVYFYSFKMNYATGNEQFSFTSIEHLHETYLVIFILKNRIFFSLEKRS